MTDLDTSVTVAEIDKVVKADLSKGAHLEREALGDNTKANGVTCRRERREQEERKKSDEGRSVGGRLYN